MSTYQHLEDALSGFTDARAVIKGADDSIFPLGYKGDKFDFYRFVNRYRMAKQFGGIVLDGFEQPTTDGHSALTRVFLVWSVFERYCELAGDPPPYKQLLSLVPKLEFNKLALVVILLLWIFIFLTIRASATMCSSTATRAVYGP